MERSPFPNGIEEERVGDDLSSNSVGPNATWEETPERVALLLKGGDFREHGHVVREEISR